MARQAQQLPAGEDASHRARQSLRWSLGFGTGQSETWDKQGSNVPHCVHLLAVMFRDYILIFISNIFF